MANLYDLKKFDLNLLVIFECIYQHLSISKAAETLYITPSAVSQSLQRLRAQLNDPLFIRSGKGITATTVGINLHHHLEKNLNELEQTINILHGSDLKKNFVIYCPQMASRGRMLSLINLLIADEHYEVEQRDILLSPESAEDLLAYRKADIVLTFAPVNNRSIICTHFITVPTVMVSSANHPRLKESATTDALLQERFTFYQSNQTGVKEFQVQVNDAFPERNIVFRSDSLISLVTMISASDLVGYIPETVFDTYRSSLNLKRIEAPFALPSVDLYMLFNRSALNSSVFAQFIERIQKN
ncbi:LysR family transcriptional regulator [Enterobacteriaceae bacterium 155047]|uniref:DNA-binding transcriptional repressor CitR n=1 Tax=Huaxiibacter chinensis TaxID=2899785 RepID=UPI0007DA7C5B|nr:LysR family transcriptional regulator [Huaxiibacter chinensis]ANG91987.1 LysR family transcriptional regulator [Lelliottia amnigena]MCG5043211.1 LysR family transcriptional regulator [Huaxiibacter chinensis]